MRRKPVRGKTKAAWVVTVDMGLGHQRAAYPLRELAPQGKILVANNYPHIPRKDREYWNASRKFYELISNIEQLPLVGKFIFGLFDRIQRVEGFYPKRDLSKPTIAVTRIASALEKGWGSHFIALLDGSLPLLSTFFVPAFMAEYSGYKGQIYCMATDADISRSWVPREPAASKIRYFAPTARAADRLKQYGVSEERIYLTGFPLPKENIGSPKFEIARRDTALRIVNLDPDRAYRSRYETHVKAYVPRVPKQSKRPLTIMFSIGGAGAQSEIAIQALKSLAPHIRRGDLTFILAAGTREDTKHELINELKVAEFFTLLGRGITVLWENEITNYFAAFNRALRETDILWTKPSELSFYAALGIPIIIAPPLGSHEEKNQEWLISMGAGMDQHDPRYAAEWIFDRVRSGWFAEAAMQGFVEGEKMGTFNIERIVRLHEKTRG